MGTASSAAEHIVLVVVVLEVTRGASSRNCEAASEFEPVVLRPPVVAVSVALVVRLDVLLGILPLANRAALAFASSHALGAVESTLSLSLPSHISVKEIHKR